MELTGTFIHHVYFWMRDPDSTEDVQKLHEGLKKLTEITSIKDWHIGKPADTSRDVIDGSYALSWMLTFSRKYDQESYQTDPIHLDFVETCSPLWTRVIVYDSVDA